MLEEVEITPPKYTLMDGEIVIGDFTRGWDRCGATPEQKQTDLDAVNNAKWFHVTLPREYTRFIEVPYVIAYDADMVLSKTKGFPIGSLYGATDTIVVKTPDHKSKGGA